MLKRTNKRSELYIIGILTVLILFGFQAQVFAHSPIEDRFPKDGAIFKTPPVTVEVWFKDPVEIYSDSIVVRDNEGTQVTGTKTVMDKDNPRHIILTFQSDLAPNTYEVEVNVIGQDGHIIKDEFDFIVEEPELTEAERFERLKLLKVSPADAEMLQASPEFIELWFSETAELSAFAVLDDHQQIVQTKEPNQGPDDGGHFKIEFEEALRKGTYSIFWNASIGENTKLGTTYFAVDEVTSIVGDASLRTETFWDRLNLSQFANWISFMALLSLVGGLFFQWRISRGKGNVSRWEMLARYLAITGMVGFGLKLIGLKISYAQIPFNEWLTLTIVWMTFIQVVLLGLGMLFRSLKLKLVMYSLAALLWALEGHSASSSYGGRFGVFIDALHLFAIAIWLGGLIALVVLMPKGQSGSWYKETGGTFAKWAFVSILITGLTGVWMWLNYVPSFSWSSLTSSHWGVLLIVKIALYAAIVILGFFQRKALRGWLQANFARFIRRTWAEWIAACIILLAAALLIDMSPQEATQGVFPNKVVQGDIEASVEVTPLQIGANDFNIQFQNQPDLKEVYVIFYMTPEWIVENKAFSMGDGRYFLTGNFFHAPGALKMEVKAMTNTDEMIVFPYNIQIPGTMNTQ
jgi:copper transport protein